MIKNKKYIATGILIAIVILFSSYVFAFGVNSNYWSENPLKLYPGETADIFLTLKTGATTGDINIQASILAGSEIAKIIDPSDIYLVPENGEKNVNIRVSVPSNAKIGDVYSVSLNFITVKNTTGGGLGFKSAIGRSIPVIVVEIPKTAEELAASKALMQNIYLAIKIAGVIAIAAAIIFLCTRKKRKVKNR